MNMDIDGLVAANKTWQETDGAEGIRANLHSAPLENARLAGVSLPGMWAPFVKLNGANLSGANLSGANLAASDLSGANLSRADLSGAKLGGAKLIGANLMGANLSGANLDSADLTEADLSGADLSGAQLWRIDMSYCLIAGATIGSKNRARALTAGAVTERDDSARGRRAEIRKMIRNLEKTNSRFSRFRRTFMINAESYPALPFLGDVIGEMKTALRTGRFDRIHKLELMADRMIQRCISRIGIDTSYCPGPDDLADEFGPPGR